MTATVGVGLIGLGTVGSAVARRLVDEWQLLGHRAGATPVLRRVAVRDPARSREVSLPGVRLDSDPDGLVDDPEVGVVVEVMGGVDRATELMARALRLGKPVITANKAALAAHGIELGELAAERGVSLGYEAAAGGGIPVVAMLRDSLRGDRIVSMEMIINGTTNIILTKMARDGVTLADALGDAQRRGFAEADPSADIDGHDAAAKLLLLSRLAFDARLTAADVSTIGIGAVDPADIAASRRLGAGVKLVGHALLAEAGLALSVRPTVVCAGHPLDGVDDADNAVAVVSDLAGHVVIRGLGGGGESTASAVVSDIVASVRTPGQPQPVPAADLAVAEPGGVERGGYLRVRLRQVPDAVELVLQALEDRGLVVAASDVAGGGSDLAVLTAPAPRDLREHAAQTLDSLAAVDTVAAVLDCVGTG